MTAIFAAILGKNCTYIHKNIHVYDVKITYGTGKKLCRLAGMRVHCVHICICKIFTNLPTYQPIKRPPGNQHTNNNNNNNIQRQDSTFSIQLNSHLKTIVIDKHFTSF